MKAIIYIRQELPIEFSSDELTFHKFMEHISNTKFVTLNSAKFLTKKGNVSINTDQIIMVEEVK